MTYTVISLIGNGHPVKFESLADAALCLYSRRMNQPTEKCICLDADNFICPSANLITALQIKVKEAQHVLAVADFVIAGEKEV